MLCNIDSVVMGGLATVNVTDLTNGVADIFFEDVLEPRPAPARRHRLPSLREDPNSLGLPQTDSGMLP